MANEIANLVLSAIMSSSKDTGLGVGKDVVSIATLGMNKTGAGIKYYHSDGNLGDPEVLVLNNGSIEDPFGDAITFLTLHAIYIKNNTGAELQVGAGATPLNLFGDKVNDTFEMVNGSIFMYLNESGLTIGADDTLTITGSAGAADIIIIGSTS